jgi:hypothetical protein
MKANELSEGIYEKLVSLNYQRKENNLYNVHSGVDFNSLSDELVNVILSFPTRQVGWFEDLMSIEDLNKDQQFYLFESEDKTFLVDTQGYDYPRYIIELEGFNDVDDTYERMDGLARIEDVTILQSVVKSLAFDLENEGFDRADIIHFIDAKICGTLLIKKN